jgi:hypothetical protein
LLGTERRKNCVEVRLVFRSQTLALVEQLDLWSQHAPSFRRCRPIQLRNGAPDPFIASVYPVVSLCVVDHQLKSPWLPGGDSTPDVVDGEWQWLAHWPRPQGSGRIGGMRIPTRERCPDSAVVTPQDQHVDVVVRPSLLAKKQIESPATR